MSFIPFLQAAQGQGGIMTMILPLALIFVIFYVFMIRPQNRKQKETERMISELKKGDKVITIGGIHGTVSSTKEKTVIIKVDDETKLEFNRNAVATVVVDRPGGAAVPERPRFSLASLFGGRRETVAETKPPEAAPSEPSASSDSAAPNS